MRVCSGTAKGKKLLSLEGNSTRPIMDKVKQALFNIIYDKVENCDFLDLFAGTGAVGIEALSRGAKKAIFIEIDKKAYQITKENLIATNLINSAEVRNADAFSYLKNTIKTFDIIYVDPPQFKSLSEEALQLISEKPSLLNNDALVITKIHPKEYEELNSSTIVEIDKRKYGNSMLVFYRKK